MREGGTGADCSLRFASQQKIKRNRRHFNYVLQARSFFLIAARLVQLNLHSPVGLSLLCPFAARAACARPPSFISHLHSPQLRKHVAETSPAASECHWKSIINNKIHTFNLTPPTNRLLSRPMIGSHSLPIWHQSAAGLSQP
jgi:hypothetical protein